MSVSLNMLNKATEKLLEGDLNLAHSYFNRARNEGVARVAVDLRFLTKNYLVYPLEYENAVRYFQCLLELNTLAKVDEVYKEEYCKALASFVDLKRLFLRSVSLFYFSDIAVCNAGSTVVKEILNLRDYVKENKNAIFNDDIFELKKYMPSVNLETLKMDFNMIEAFCLNLLLSYTAEQHSVYTGKKYSAVTVDYGYFYSTEVKARDQYYNYANIKPRLFLILGYEAYYDDFLQEYKEKLSEIKNFDCPKVLRAEVKKFVFLKDKSDESAKEFNKYAKLFEKDDNSRSSYIKSLLKLNPFARPFMGFYNAVFGFDYVGSFELDVYFPRKVYKGVCNMISCSTGWNLGTVRLLAIFFGGMLIGVFAYAVLAIAMKKGYYFGVNVEKH